MTTKLETTLKVIALIGNVMFLVYVIFRMFSHTGPDERNSRTRYNQTDQDD